MIIRANDVEVQVKSVISDKLKKNGTSYPALRFEFDNEIPAEAVSALMSGVIEILDDDGNVIGTHEGYNTKGSISLVVGKITTAEEKVAELETALADSQAANAELQEALNVVVGGSEE